MTRRLATNAVPRLDVFMLHRSGALTTGAVTRWVWPPMLTITARCEEHRLFLSLNGSAEVPYVIIRRPGTTGGSYPFLECTCERSARFLYIRNSQIACYRCHGLDYTSRMPRQWNTTMRRLHRTRAKLAALELEALEMARRSNGRLKFIRGSVHD
jgi:hypothetical protein